MSDRTPVAAGPVAAEEADRRVEAALTRLRAGDDDARWSVVEAVFERFRGAAANGRRDSRAVKRWEQTGDVLATAAIKLHRDLANFRPEKTAGVYFLMAETVRRVVTDFARRHTGRGGFAGTIAAAVVPPGKSIPVALAAAATETSSPAVLAEWTDFHAAAGRLDAPVREVWDLRFYAAMSERDAADRLGVTVRTVRRRYRDAKIALAEHLPSDAP